MLSRSPAALVLLVAVASALLAMPTSAGAIWSGLPACSAATPTQCIDAVSRNGVAVSPSDPDYDVQAIRFLRDGAVFYNFSVDRAAGGNTLDLGDTWSVRLNTGATFPEETFARGRSVLVARGGTAAGGYTAQFTMRPVRMATTVDGCGGTGACPADATQLRPGYLDGWVDDLEYLDDPLDRAAMRGFDLASNTDWVSSPLQLDFATNTIQLDVANAHFEPASAGHAVFLGHAEFRLPNPMLQRLYNVDDPASLTVASFRVATLGVGATPTTTLAVDPGSVRVSIDGMTFSRRTLRIIGRTTPTHPRFPHLFRVSRTSGQIRSMPARSRGSRVRGYVAFCRSGDLLARGSVTGNPSPVRIPLTGLRPSRAYSCSYRARSRAGLGIASTLRLPALPS